MGYIETIHEAGDPRGEHPDRLHISDEDMEQFETGEITRSQLNNKYDTRQRDDQGIIVNLSKGEKNRQANNTWHQ